jgi:hypothetical protein
MEDATSAYRMRAWTRPVLGLSLFGARESGSYGARALPLLGVPEPVDSTEAPAADPDTLAVEPGALFHVSDRSATRFGAQWARWGWVLSGARLELEADALLALGIEPDRGEAPFPGGQRSGWEAWGRVPLPLNGFSLEGSLQQWDEGWSYLPRRIYAGALVFHRVYLESGNFELHWTTGVRGRDPMTVRQRLAPESPPQEGEEPVLELASVPFYQSWYTRLQMRIVSVRIFIGWENFTVRGNLQDFPDRLLPGTRAVYGLRWTMWN